MIKNNSIKPLPLADPGKGPGGLFLDQTEAQRAPQKNFMRPPPPPPIPLSNGLDDPHPPPPPLFQGLDPAMITIIFRAVFFIFSCEFYLHFYLQLHDPGTIQSQVI